MMISGMRSGLLIGLSLLSVQSAHVSTLPSSAVLMPLRGGEGHALRRQLSHQDIKAELHGAPDTLDARVYAKDTTEGEHRSLWHDLPLFEVSQDDGKPTGALNFVCEIPKWTRKKFEIATKEPLNPIKQDEKKGQLRSFKKGDIYFNYGCFPRTWEDPDFVHPEVGVGGDNDPLDVCEIGLKQIPTGKVRPVKVLGVLCMVDEGEADWKVIAIDREDQWAKVLHDISDVEALLPGTLDTIREWFRTYKIPDGKPPNVFALGEKFMPRAYALAVIHETHAAWARLVRGSVEEAQEQLAAAAAAPKPTEQEAAAAAKAPVKRFTMKRNLSVPALDALKQVEGSLLTDENALNAALAKAKID